MKNSFESELGPFDDIIFEEDWSEIFEKDDVEHFQKLFHLLSRSKQLWSLELAGERNAFKIVKSILQIIQSDLDELKQILKNALLKWKSLEMIKCLVEHEPSIDLEIFLFYSVEIGRIEVFKYLLEKGVQIGKENEDSFLFTAIFRNRFEIAKYLFEEKKFDIDKQNYDGETPFFFGCYVGALEIVKYLVERNVEFNISNRKEETGFFIACQRQHLSIVNYLLELKGVDLSKRNQDGETTLYIASSFESLEIVKALVESKKFDINEKTKDGFTPLAIAAFRGNLPIVRYLIENNADFRLTNNQGLTPLQIAIEQEKIEVVNFLTKIESNPNHFLDNK